LNTSRGGDSTTSLCSPGQICGIAVNA